MKTDFELRIPGTLAKYGRADYRCHLRLASGNAPQGHASTPREAKARLIEAVLWTMHMTDPTCVHDARGGAWLIYPGHAIGLWCARRMYVQDGQAQLSTGLTMFEAPTWSAACECVRAWNARGAEAI